MTKTTDSSFRNPYASGDIEVPSPFGGVALFAVLDDGEALCEQCVRDATNPVHPDNGEQDGWGVIGFDTTGNTDGGVTCAHCGKVLQAEAGDEDDEDVTTTWHTITTIDGQTVLAEGTGWTYPEVRNLAQDLANETRRPVLLDLGVGEQRVTLHQVDPNH